MTMSTTTTHADTMHETTNPTQRTDLYIRVIYRLRHLNIYTDADTMPIHDQVIATRICLCLTIVTLLVFALLNGLNTPSRLVTIHNPSLRLFEQLSITHTDTLTCSCTYTSILYAKFLRFSPRFHAVCSSPLVDMRWIASLSPVDSLEDYHPLDFRYFASTQFQALASLCDISQTVVSNALDQLLSSEIISKQLLSRWNFDAHMRVVVDQFQRETLATVTVIDRFVSLSLTYSRLTSALRTNHFHVFNTDLQGIGYYTSFAVYPQDVNVSHYNGNPYLPASCSCLQSSQCSFESAIYPAPLRCSAARFYWPCLTPNMTVIGMKIGCFLLNALYQSTLQCFYNASCYRVLLAFLDASITDISSLIDTQQPSRFDEQSLIGAIFGDLFIESWHNSSSFSSYFDACAPSSCTYSSTGKFDFVSMITTLFGMIGGLSVALHFISPYILRVLIRKIIAKCVAHVPCIKSIRSDESTQQQEPRSSIKQHAIKVIQRLSQKLIRLNLYKTGLLNDEDGIHVTRLFLFLLWLGLMSLTMYVSVIPHTQIAIIHAPTPVQFEALYKQYPLTVSCPCQQTIFDYSSIMTIHPRYHQICGSVFVDHDGWLAYFRLAWLSNEAEAEYQLHMMDFRVLGLSMFSLLSALCTGISDLVVKETREFNRTQLITEQALLRDDFIAKTNIIMDRFSRQVMTNFGTLQQLFDIQLRRNELMLTELNNVRVNLYQEYGVRHVRFFMRRYHNGTSSCSCGESNLCYWPQGFYKRAAHELSPNPLPMLPIPGLFFGCYPMDSLLLSTLECFYRQSCVNMLLAHRDYDIRDYIRPMKNTLIVALNETALTSFSPTSKLSTLIERGFVEEWTTTADFDAYYRQCQPKLCTYTWVGKYPPVLITITVIGLSGGLKIILLLLSPLLFKTIKLILRCPNRAARLAVLRQQQAPLLRMRRIIDFLLSLNLYKRHAPQHDAIFATRLYLTLLTYSLFYIALFVKVDNQIFAVTIHTPTRDRIDSLRMQHPSTLVCPCSHKSVSYGKFHEIQPIYHQICIHLFSQTDWITDIFRFGETNVLLEWQWLSAMFLYLQSMCQVSENIVQQSIMSFLAGEMVTSSVISEQDLQAHLVVVMTALTTQMRTSFQLMNRMISDKFRLNHIQDRHMTVWRMITTDISYVYVMNSVPVRRDDDSCICAAGHTACSWPMTWRNTTGLQYNLPGLFGGCGLVRGFRQSTLECWFDQSCFQRVLTMVRSSASPRTMNASISSRFSPTRTVIGDIVDELFVESWQNVSNYTSYLDACAPLTCEYVNEGRANTVQVLSVLLGLYGGLTVVWRFVAWRSIRAGRWIVGRCRRTVTPAQDSVS